MKVLSILGCTALVASVATARCGGIKFDIVHFNPPTFKSGEEIHVTYYGDVSRTVDRDVRLHTTFYNKDGKVIHKDVFNWCATLERYGGHCPMAVEDGFKITFPHKFKAKVKDFIYVDTQAFGRMNACYVYRRDQAPVAK